MGDIFIARRLNRGDGEIGLLSAEDDVLAVLLVDNFDPLSEFIGAGELLLVLYL